MNLFDFSNRFPDEAACVKYLKEKREEEGIIYANLSCWYSLVQLTR